jgi:threonine dehydrogenase-like Zn-dependent dehydrogenase
MKALVFTDLGVVKIQEVPDVVAGEGDVIVIVDRAGICGSELHGISTPGPRVPPLIMGHEVVGHTSDGRRVAINPLTSCGTCDLCALGKTQLCRTRLLIGIHKAGGFAERVVVPKGSIHELPDELDFDRAALIEPLANAVHGWNLAGAPKGLRVGVLGCGPIGLACVEMAHYGGAAGIFATDLSENRRLVAEKVGATDVGEALEGEFDVIFDAVGSATTHQSSIEHLIPGGTTVWLGLGSPNPGFDALSVVRLEKNIRGSFAYSDEEFVKAVDIAPSLDLTWSTTYPLGEGAEIFTSLMNGDTSPIKALLQP